MILFCRCTQVCGSGFWPRCQVRKGWELFSPAGRQMQACAQGSLQMESPAPPACASVWAEQLGPSRAKLAMSKSISRHHKTSSFLALCRCSVPPLAACVGHRAQGLLSFLFLTTLHGHSTRNWLSSPHRSRGGGGVELKAPSRCPDAFQGCLCQEQARSWITHVAVHIPPAEMAALCLVNAAVTKLFPITPFY